MRLDGGEHLSGVRLAGLGAFDCDVGFDEWTFVGERGGGEGASRKGCEKLATLHGISW